MQWLFIGIVCFVFVFEMVVSHLNHQHRKKPMPDVLSDVYDQDRYQKWLAYSLDQHRFKMITRGFNLLILLLMLVLGFFRLLENFTSTLSNSLIIQTLLFLGIFQTILTLISIPFKYYAIFNIEERHGFNRTTKKTFMKDLIMSYLLMIILGGLILSGIQAIYLAFIDRVWLFIFVTWFAITLVMVLMFTCLSRLFLRLFNKFTPLEEGTLKSRIESLAISIGFSIKSISIMDASRRSTKLNAFFTDIGKMKEVVLFDTLIEKMTEDEVLAVLAHELGHAKHKDTLWMFFEQLDLVFLYALTIGFILNRAIFFEAFGLTGIHFGFSLILFMILFEPISILLGIPINAFSRRAEYRADAFAKLHTSKEAMISALKVLSREDLVNLSPHPLAVILYYSHPPMKDRILSLLS